MAEPSPPLFSPQYGEDGDEEDTEEEEPIACSLPPATSWHHTITTIKRIHRPEIKVRHPWFLGD